MDPRSEIEVRERLTRLEASTQHDHTRQEANITWITRLSTRVQHLETEIARIYGLKGRVESLEEHSQITRRERERRVMIKAGLHYLAAAIGSVAVVYGAISEEQASTIMNLFGSK